MGWIGSFRKQVLGGLGWPEKGRALRRNGTISGGVEQVPEDFFLFK